MDTETDYSWNQNHVPDLKIQPELFSDTCLSKRGTLSRESKRLLSLPSQERADDGILNLLTELEEFNFFHKFNNEIKRELAIKMVFVTADPNRFLLQQGSTPQGMFLLTSGVVSLRYNLLCLDSDSEKPNGIENPKPGIQKLSELESQSSVPKSDNNPENNSELKNDSDLQSQEQRQDAPQSNTDLKQTGSSSIPNIHQVKNNDRDQPDENADSESCDQKISDLESHDQKVFVVESNIQIEGTDSESELNKSNHDTKSIDAPNKQGSVVETNEQEIIEVTHQQQQNESNCKYQQLRIDPDFIIKSQWPEKVLSNGAFFGHEDLLHIRPSTVDAIAVGYSELLLLKEEDFHLVQNIFEDENTQLQEYLRSTETLKAFSWTGAESNVLEIFSEIRTYDKAVEIYRKRGDALSKWSYFVVSGECKLTREVTFQASEESRSKDASGILSEEKTQSFSKFHVKNLVFENVQQGFFFGVGESFGNNRVITAPATNILMIPRLVLVFKNKELLSKMAEDLSASLPTDQELFEKYGEYKRATLEVNKILKDILKDKPSQLTSSEKVKQKPRFVI